MENMSHDMMEALVLHVDFLGLFAEISVYVFLIVMVLRTLPWVLKGINRVGFSFCQWV